MRERRRSDGRLRHGIEFIPAMGSKFARFEIGEQDEWEERLNCVFRGE